MEATTNNETVTITVKASDARLMGEALMEMRRMWADEADQAAQTNDFKGMNHAAMRAQAAERVGGELHGAGWEAALNS